MKTADCYILRLLSKSTPTQRQNAPTCWGPVSGFGTACKAADDCHHGICSTSNQEGMEQAIKTRTERLTSPNQTQPTKITQAKAQCQQAIKVSTKHQSPTQKLTSPNAAQPTKITQYGFRSRLLKGDRGQYIICKAAHRSGGG